ncbi:MAG: hypothetical protein JNL68_11630 [Burkholderiales bacterium]|nr:hypothetical protein [Burkholderiales bacterium]
MHANTLPVDPRRYAPACYVAAAEFDLPSDPDEEDFDDDEEEDDDSDRLQLGLEAEWR